MCERNESLCLHKNINTNWYSSVNHSNHKGETPKCPSTEEWINTCGKHIQQNIEPLNKKERSTGICNNMCEF
jgi:hypothetical protein